MLTDTENIKKTFSIFHDGTISGFENHADGIKVKIDCFYLSERINPEFECFYVHLMKPTKLEFIPWSDKGFPRKIISDLVIISKWEYNIFTCKIENGQYQVDVEIENPKTALIGGSLNFECQGINIYDEGMTEVSFEQLFKVSKEYWTEFEEGQK